MNINSTAQSQYFTRPADESYESFAAFTQAAKAREARCKETLVEPRSLTVVSQDGILALKGQHRAATLNHWSVGQVAQLCGAPASYIRTLSPDTAAQCLSESWQARSGRMSDRLKLYLESGSTPLIGQSPALGSASLTLRAINGADYARVPDSFNGEIALMLQGAGFDRPPVWNESRPQKGAYLGESDSFLIAVNGGSIVPDPTRPRDSAAKLFRGVILQNSMVGKSAWSATTFLFESICGNHRIMGVRDVNAKRRRHRGKNTLTDIIGHVSDLVETLAGEDLSQLSDEIVKLNAQLLGADDDSVVKAAQAFGLSESQAKLSLDLAKEYAIEPRSFWGLTDGITRLSQRASHADERLSMDLMAAAILAKGRQLVAA